MAITFAPAVPILRLFDESKTRDFYVGFLGFKVDWEHRFEPDMPLYMQVSRGGCLIHLSEHHGDVAPGGGVRIGVDDIVAYRTEIMAKGYKYMRPGIEDTPWGTSEMKVMDPSFNRLTFFAPRNEGS
ncbi:glyoxalase/bleomycin resistance/extradiol dioxygenase family protein [Hyphomicrobium methylovorum]|uniref:glyoxalase superfamily protein n=1 Tax=Hyphomicrobium methylovorum TaxID=84 RepID=UPI0015E6D561|nr:glyoxalase superfamily protein [Hyphomicrobium methylovorum]MBA2126948.1 glyoxalase/bleomycin resistance/extradiol dioxygenase family protein [Hyphomicrobium methylovorum]